MRLPRRAARMAAGLLVFVAAAAASSGAPPAAAATPAFVYDCLSWNPRGDTLCVLAWPDPDAGAAPPRRLYVPVDPAAPLTVAPDVRLLQVAPDGASALLLGDGGLWWYAPASGRLIQLRYQSPAATERMYDFAFRAGGEGAVFLTGTPGDRYGAFYRWTPAEGVVRVAERTAGTPGDAAWQAEARPAGGPSVGLVRSARRVTVPGTPAIVMDYDGRDLIVDAGYGGPRATLDNVVVSWVAWPPDGGRALLSIGHRADRRAELLAVSGDGFKPLATGETTFGGWLADGTALLADADGRLLRYRPAADSLAGSGLDAPPAWARRLAHEAEVISLAVTRWPRSARKFDSQVELLKKAAARLPGEWRAGAAAYGRRMLGGDQRVGVFPSDEAALAGAAAFRESGMSVQPAMTRARDMSGAFDYGRKLNGPGDAAWIRRLDGGGAEVWLQKPGADPIRLLTREMTR